MECSAIAQANRQPIPSPDGLHIASITASKLQIRSSNSHGVFRSITLPPSEGSKPIAFRWAPISTSQPWSYRLLLADSDGVRVWDLRDPKWTAYIDNGTNGTGRIAHVDFGRDLDEVITISEFGAGLTCWSLLDGQSVEIKDPKFASGRSYAYRPRQQQGDDQRSNNTELLAVLSRPSAQDVLTLYSPTTQSALASIELPSHDAQGLQWSPDGNWLTVWDSAAYGTSVWVYTADGQLYRTYSGSDASNEHPHNGVKSISWSPDSKYLAVGEHSHKITMLSSRTVCQVCKTKLSSSGADTSQFAPAMVFEHADSVSIEDGAVWQEQASASSASTYIAATQPALPPTVTATGPNTPSGIAQISFNATGTLLASRDELAPTAVWIWDLQGLKPRAVLLQHSNVKRMSWHPSRQDLLLIQCCAEAAVVYLWSALSDSPMVLAAPVRADAVRMQCAWLHTDVGEKPGILVNNASEFVTLWPDGRDVHSREGSDDGRDGDESFDSVIEMLAGRTPLPDATEKGLVTGLPDDLAVSVFDDTFRWKKG